MTSRYLVFILFSAILLAGCLGPGGGPPTPTPMPTMTATPTPQATYSPAQLKYLVLDHYGEGPFFYCDPDYYPIAHGDELERAISMLPEIENDTATFAAIISRKGFVPPYTNETKLAIYREYKKLNAIQFIPLSTGTFGFSLQLGTFQGGQRVSGTVRNDGIILSEQTETAILTCPICLTGETRIDTPSGQVRVKDIHAGMLVWTPDGNGGRTAVPVLLTVKTPVPASHRLVHLELSDGRELFASPGHPLGDGRQLGMLAVGNTVDGATVIGVGFVPCTGGFTYDILPAGDTGVYWADGIPLKSTLF
jgi:hypothetical protein